MHQKTNQRKSEREFFEKTIRRAVVVLRSVIH